MVAARLLAWLVGGRTDGLPGCLAATTKGSLLSWCSFRSEAFFSLKGVLFDLINSTTMTTTAVLDGRLKPAKQEAILILGFGFGLGIGSDRRTFDGWKLRRALELARTPVCPAARRKS